MDTPPPFLPPRRPASLPDLLGKRTCESQKPVDTPPAFLPPRTLSSRAETKAADGQLRSREEGRHLSRTDSSGSMPDNLFGHAPSRRIQRSNSDRPRRLLTDRRRDSMEPALCPRVQRIRDGEQPCANLLRPQNPTRSTVLRPSSLRIEDRPSEEDDEPPALPPKVLVSAHSVPQLSSGLTRSSSHPLLQASLRAKSQGAVPTLSSSTSRPMLGGEDDTCIMQSLPELQDISPLSSPVLGPRPRASLARLSSLDNLITYRAERAEWKRASTILQNRLSDLQLDGEDPEKQTADLESGRQSQTSEVFPNIDAPSSGTETPLDPKRPSKFRHVGIEVGFCFTIAMTQFLAEYLISGFAIELPRILEKSSEVKLGGPGLFWPASLLSLILSAMLLFFARVSDMYGGYLPFMFGVIWLTIWTLIPGFTNSSILLDISRAMEGLAIAAFLPSTFAMIGSIYSEGPRKNVVLGLYSGCAPLGFFAGFLTAGALPTNKPQWYFWIASALSGVTALTAYLTVPHDRTDRTRLGLKMDWLGAFLITAGLILVSYALAVEPYTTDYASGRSGFGHPTVYAPLVVGIACLIASVYVEGWYADCPLLPLDFFKPKSVLAFCLAGLCFYASYGVWLYMSAEYFQSPSQTTGTEPLTGVELAIWYTPTAVGGLILCVVGGALLHIVPIKLLLLLSGLAWIGAPLLLALAPVPLNYWEFVLPSMLCATLGIDLTFTVSIVFFSSVQPLRYQGLSGAVSSILVNLAISFSLFVSEIVLVRAEAGAMAGMSDGAASLNPGQIAKQDDHITNWGFQAAFIYAAASAGLGFTISMLFVRISRSAVRERPTVEDQP